MNLSRKTNFPFDRKETPRRGYIAFDYLLMQSVHLMREHSEAQNSYLVQGLNERMSYK